MVVKIFGNGVCGCDWCRKQNKVSKIKVNTLSKKERKIIEMQKKVRTK